MRTTAIYGGIIVIALASLFGISRLVHPTVQPKAVAAASALATDIYTWSQEDRDSFLYWSNEQKQYQVVANATYDGVQNHKEMVWDDIGFWNHRGVALYRLGQCAEAYAAFYHVTLRDPQNDIATGLLRAIETGQCTQATTTPTGQ